VCSRVCTERTCHNANNDNDGYQRTSDKSACTKPDHTTTCDFTCSSHYCASGFDRDPDAECYSRFEYECARDDNSPCGDRAGYGARSWSDCCTKLYDDHDYDDYYNAVATGSR
jgi:hypothetical protein